MWEERGWCRKREQGVGRERIAHGAVTSPCILGDGALTSQWRICYHSIIILDRSHPLNPPTHPFNPPIPTRSHDCSRLLAMPRLLYAGVTAMLLTYTRMGLLVGSGGGSCASGVASDTVTTPSSRFVCACCMFLGVVVVVVKRGVVFHKRHVLSR